MRGSCDGRGPNGLPPEPLEEPVRAGLHGRVEPQRTRCLGSRTRGTNQRGTGTTLRGCNQPPALPPPDIRPVGRRTEPNTPDHSTRRSAARRACNITGDQYDGARVLVAVIQIAAVEEALLVNEGSSP
jgi:hypothetical protein